MEPYIWPEVRKLCDTCISEACKREGARCCRSFEVHVSEAKRVRIEDRLDEISQYAPWLRQPDGSYDDVFEEADDGRLAIVHREGGGCPFLFSNEQGWELCAIHATALAAGEDPIDLKPRECSTWPLAITRHDGRWSVDLVAEAREWGCAGVDAEATPLVELAERLLSDRARAEIELDGHTA